MLPRRLRISRQAFSGAARARRYASEHFSVAAADTPEGHGGCATVVSKKVARLSTARHLLKRRMSSVMRPFCTTDRSLVVYALPGSPLLPYRTLAAELRPLLERAFTR